MKRTAVVFAIAGSSMACVSTKLHYQAVPDLPPEGFHRVLVFAAFEDLEYRQTVEGAAMATFRSRGIDARSGSEFMMRVRDLSSEEQRAAAVADGVEAFFLVEPRGSGSKPFLIPMPDTTTATTTTIGGVTTTTARTAGNDIPSTRSWSDAQVTLVDPVAGRSVWEATVKGDDQGWGYEMSDVLRKMAEKAAIALVEQRILRPPVR